MEHVFLAEVFQEVQDLGIDICTTQMVQPVANGVLDVRRNVDAHQCSEFWDVAVWERYHVERDIAHITGESPRHRSKAAFDEEGVLSSWMNHEAGIGAPGGVHEKIWE